MISPFECNGSAVDRDEEREYYRSQLDYNSRYSMSTWLIHLRLCLAVGLTVVVLSGCDSKIEYVKWDLPRQNPTSWVFHRPLDTVRAIAIVACDEIPGMIVETADSLLTSLAAKEFFSHSENQRDLFVDNLGRPHSRIYVGTTEKVPYFFKIGVHFVAFGSDSTQVSVTAIDPTISIGVRFPYNILPISEPGVALTKPVEGSSIEEYEVLLTIGGALGEKDAMPPLVLPQPPAGK